MNHLLEKLFIFLLFIILLGSFFLGLFPVWKMKMTGFEDIWLKKQRNRRDILNNTCLKNSSSSSEWQLEHNVAWQLFVDENHKFIYCEVPKVGCSNWKKIILLFTLNLSRDTTEVNHERIHTTKLLKRLSTYPPEQQMELLNTYTKVMFSRHPLERLVSAYRDKFLHSEPYYSITVANEIKVFSRKDINSTNKITFQEFVNYLVTRNQSDMDIHWKPMFLLCDPCNIHYDILGKLETLAEDVDHVLRRIGAPESLHYPNGKMNSSEKRTSKAITSAYIKQLSFEQMQKVKQVYQKDFSLFNYSCN
ncbi:carbohydrate sulfotransferase 8 [Anolis carolinensis]|uniref:Carbohydrate sulfotransferase n=1 Tax=Anolis carolinensis TaxID=28377 RepID=A0A803T3R9_ANOCA|nr:PREDICTED: carbohydrate sulfotransferase 8 [Anolis carolinensis]|eukprot:XP_008102590.1 PREDICTED: carbohydrate sulfotransferase 8 [Anolis carolinensis]